MHWRSRSHVLLSIALFAPLVVPSVARAQDASPQTPAPTAPAVAVTPAPATDAPPPAPPVITPAPAPVSPSRDQQDLAAQGALRPDAGDLAPAATQVFS